MPTHSHLPSEIVDSIIDLLKGDTKALKECCLVSRSWVPRTRKYLFEEIGFWSRGKIDKWKRAFPVSAGSLAHYVRSLRIDWGTPVDDEYEENEKWIRSFTNLTKLRVIALGGLRGNKPRLDAFHNLSPFIKSLHLYSTSLKKAFDLVYSFPLLEDLTIEGNWDTDGEEDGAVFQYSTSPAFSGTLKLGLGLKSVSHKLLDLRHDLHFRKIIWKVSSPLQLESVKALLERCSATLEYIGIVFCQCNPATSPLDLSKATKLKEVRFWYTIGLTGWVAATLNTITTENKSLERVSFCFFYIPASTGEPVKTVTELAGDETYQQLDLNENLFQLFESRAIRMTAVCAPTYGMRKAARFLKGLVAERRRGLIDVVFRDLDNLPEDAVETMRMERIGAMKHKVQVVESLI